MSKLRQLTTTQKQILRFLGYGGPAYIFTGSRVTRCGAGTSGRRIVETNSTTRWALEQYELVTYDHTSDTYAANREHPQVARLLDPSR